MPKRRASSKAPAHKTKRIAITTKKTKKAKKAGYDLDCALEIFDRYKNENQMIDMSGTEKLCQDLNIDCEDIVFLVIAWKFSCKKLGCFTKEEWIEGTQKLGVDTIEGLKGMENEFRQCLKNKSQLKEIFMFAFQIYKEDPCVRYLDYDVTEFLLKALLTDDIWPDRDLFLEFLLGNDSKVLNKDQWVHCWEFATTINRNLDNYDSSGSWPLLYDDYIEWRQEREKS